MAERMDLLIRGGVVYDGGPSAPAEASVGIAGDRIAWIGKDDYGIDADRVVEAHGLAVAPGFIDVHAHSDFTLLADPRAQGKLSQGVTTEVNGNCGMSAAPLIGKVIERREEDLRELGIVSRWHTFREYFRLLEVQGCGINTANLAGHGNLRGSVVGYDDKEPSSEEMAEMRRLLSEAVSDGAIGMSTGLIYPPGIYSSTNELTELAKVLRQPDLIYTSHMRSEGNRLQEAVDEVIRIGCETGIRVNISHIKTAGEANWHKADEVIRRLHEARGGGLRLTCDRYPYIASSTDLDSILPPWVFDGGNDEELRRLCDPSALRRIEEEISAQVSRPGYWGKIIVSSIGSEKNRWMEGKTLEEISARLSVSGMEAFFRLIVEERLRVGAIFMSMSEENLRKFLSLPFCMIGSDSSSRGFDGPTAAGKPHPRTFGTFARLFGRYVREEGLLSLPEAIHKSTMLAAETFGLKKRGCIREGYFADMVIFDPSGVTDRATFGAPFRQSEGIHSVFVNGVEAVSEGRTTGRLGGRVLRSGL
ncbi:MAG: D-aminoacylase [Nitrospiraceae bacterium]|nr:D-aminoacylase [Nitrospiraceae bacterium]